MASGSGIIRAVPGLDGPAGWRTAMAGLAVVLMIGFPTGSVRAADPSQVEAELRAAAAAYQSAFDSGDQAALADQWAEAATLVEGAGRLHGRAAIVASIRDWRDRHPGCSLAVAVDSVRPIAGPLARVTGRLRFTPKAGATPVESRFESLRVNEDGTWRILESVVVPSHAIALDELDWLVGTWHAESGSLEQGTKTTVETVYEKPLGPYCLVGRSRIRPASGPPIEALELLHADRDTGVVRSWVFDSTGARGEGIVASDGVTLHKTMDGTPADGVPGRVARWTQSVAPAGDGRCTMHSIDRSIDGVPQPDGEPLHFRRIR